MVGSVSGVTFNQRGADYDIQLIRGATINFSLVWGGATPIDVTGFSAQLQVKVNAADGTNAFTFTVANSRVSIGSTNGVITFSMTAADSAALTLGNYVYALEVIDATSKHITVASGKLKVIPGVV